MANMNKDQAPPTLSDAQIAPAGLPMLDEGDVATVSGTISVGVAWDASTRGKSGFVGKLFRKVGADLDASVVLFQDQEPVTLCIGFTPELMNPLHGQPGDGSVLHSGDNETGDGEGDDETVTLHLDKIPAEFHRIVVQVSAFKEKNKKLGDKGFQGANNVLFTVYDGAGAGADKQFCIRPSLVGTENCVIVAVLDRVGNTVNWNLSKRKVRVNVKHGDLTDLIRKAAAAN
jgi:stress response protein SCP2